MFPLSSGRLQLDPVEFNAAAEGVKVYVPLVAPTVGVQGPVIWVASRKVPPGQVTTRFAPDGAMVSVAEAGTPR